MSPFVKVSGLLFVGLVSLSLVSCGDANSIQPIEYENPMLDPAFGMSEFEKVVQVSAEERQALESAFESRDKAYGEWASERLEGVQTTEKMLAKAKADGDTTLIRSYEVKMRPALEARQAIMVEHQDLVLNAMSAETANKWHAHMIAEKLLALMEPLQLTAEQRQQAQEWAYDAVAEFPDVHNRLSGAFFALEKRMKADSLTADQRDLYERVADVNPRRGVSW